MPLTKEGNDGQPRPMKPTTTDVVGDEVGKKLQQAPATVIESPKGSTPPAIDEKPGSEKEVVDDSTKNHHEVPKDANRHILITSHFWSRKKNNTQVWCEFSPAKAPPTSGLRIIITYALAWV